MNGVDCLWVVALSPIRSVFFVYTIYLLFFRNNMCHVERKRVDSSNDATFGEATTLAASFL